jgi:hypothetical protein
MTIYLIDANVLIRADADYYPITRFQPFWDWLFQKALSRTVQMPREIFDEVAKSNDLLGKWLNTSDVKKAIILPEGTNAQTVSKVICEGYANNLNDIEIEKIGRDPFLISAALSGADRVVVTREISKPSAQRGNRKIPDICASFGIQCINDFELWRSLDFRIS